MAESKEELKNLLMKVKEESVKSWFKTQYSETKIMASGPTLHGKQMGKQWKVADFIFLGSKTTADGDCDLEIERHLAPWKKSYDKPRQHTKKQRHYFANKGPYSQSYAFSNSHVQM